MELLLKTDYNAMIKMYEAKYHNMKIKVHNATLNKTHVSADKRLRIG